MPLANRVALHSNITECVLYRVYVCLQAEANALHNL